MFVELLKHRPILLPLVVGKPGSKKILFTVHYSAVYVFLFSSNKIITLKGHCVVLEKCCCPSVPVYISVQWVVYMLMHGVLPLLVFMRGYHLLQC